MKVLAAFWLCIAIWAFGVNPSLALARSREEFAFNLDYDGSLGGDGSDVILFGAEGFSSMTFHVVLGSGYSPESCGVVVRLMAEETASRPN